MTCPQCSNVMVQARATNFGEQYWYCRSCKQELAEMYTLEPVLTNQECDLLLGPPLPGYYSTGLSDLIESIQDQLDDLAGISRKKP